MEGATRSAGRVLAGHLRRLRVPAALLSVCDTPRNAGARSGARGSYRSLAQRSHLGGGGQYRRPRGLDEGDGLGRMPWHDHWFWVRLPPMAQQANQMVLMEECGMSFANPSFPPDSRLMNLLHQGPPRLDELIAKQVASHEGPLLVAPRHEPVDSGP